jgi:hypothetical protein
MKFNYCNVQLRQLWRLTVLAKIVVNKSTAMFVIYSTIPVLILGKSDIFVSNCNRSGGSSVQKGFLYTENATLPLQ